MGGRALRQGVRDVGDRTTADHRARSRDDAKERLAQHLLTVIDDRTLELLRRRREAKTVRDRGWLLRRLLLAADLIGLLLAFLLAVVLPKAPEPSAWIDFGIFLASLPAWVVAIKLFGLYDEDEARADHSTLDDLGRVFLLVTLGAFAFAVVTGYSGGDVTDVLVFWALAIAFVTSARAMARVASHRTLSYVQNTVILGAGDIGQLVGRKLLQHPEYGINLVGFVDSEPKERHSHLGRLTVLGPPEELPEIIQLLGIERVIIAFSREDERKTLRLVASLRQMGVQVDIVPRLFEVVGPNAHVHPLEAMAMLGLPPARLSRSSRLLKRATDVAGALLLLALTAPLFAIFAWKIRRESPGPIFFRQRRLGMNQREFTLVKFRTMSIEADDGPHREYIKATMEGNGEPASNGLFKLERKEDVTAFGGWLRRTSLDELPQLINVLRGDMSLVGPRPCLPYEVEHFAPHHFERFGVPPGVTGLWQVAARAHSDFGEALDMDVLYVRSWSLGLDVRLLLRTPLQLLRSVATA